MIGTRGYFKEGFLMIDLGHAGVSSGGSFSGGAAD